MLVDFHRISVLPLHLLLISGSCVLADTQRCTVRYDELRPPLPCFPLLSPGPSPPLPAPPLPCPPPPTLSPMALFLNRLASSVVLSSDFCGSQLDAAMARVTLLEKVIKDSGLRVP